MRLVLDASALMEHILPTTAVSRFAPMIEAAHVELHAPELCDVEIVSALVKAQRLRLISESRAEEALADYLDLPMARHRHRRLLRRALKLRNNFSPYDAIYVALAEQMEATLVTADARLARAVRKHLGIEVAP